MQSNRSPAAAAIDQLAEQIGDAVRGGRTPEDAARRLSTFLPAEQVQAALSRFREATQRVRTLQEPGGIVDPYLDAWYTGPAADDKFWPVYREKLLRSGFPSESIDAIDQSTTRILASLKPPGAGQIRSRGLVLGHVQSGKTANFTALIAKAADVGYRFFLVLSGMNNALRNQTQSRLVEDLVSDNVEDWITITDATRDFRETVNVNAFLTDRHSAKVLGVVKKNGPRLRRLLNWLSGARPEVLRNCPTLLIDDEADQASPNTHRERDQRSAINALLVELLLSMPKVAYVGYTASPFANLFIDPAPPEDLYPRDFIFDIERGEGYFGPERIFGRDPLDAEDSGSDGLDMIRLVPDNEVGLVRPASREARFTFAPEVTSSLSEALLYFWLVSAARLARGQAGEHSTMLIHPSRYSDVHLAFRSPVDDFRISTLRKLQRDNRNLIAQLQRLWEFEQAAVPAAEVGEEATSFEALLPFLQDVISRTEVRVENARSPDRIDYVRDESDRGRIYVVIGGDLLSRGLTLEGLSVSYFIRGAAAYDTLLQMGRWFGYRRGYADLPRMWMTAELRDYFYDLATVEKEIRQEIDRYKSGHITPLEFAVRIRTHPQLAITSRLKMQHAVPAKMSFAGAEPQTLVFPHQDMDWLRANIEATRNLIRRIQQDGKRGMQLAGRPHWLFHEVAVDRVLEFLDEYAIHENNAAMPAELLQGYIRDQHARGELNCWTTAVVGRQHEDDELGSIDLGLEWGQVPLINRARFRRGNPELADLKALRSQLDLVLDVNVPNDAIVDTRRTALRELRERTVPGRALLILYPVSKNSRPLRANPKRERLDAADHVIGLSIVFPETEHLTPQSYMTVRMDQVEQEWADVEELDEDQA